MFFQVRFWRKWTLVCAIAGALCDWTVAAAEPIWRSLPANRTPTPRDALTLPAYRRGKTVRLRIRGRFAYLVEPNGRVDPHRRWVWIFPFEHALADAEGRVTHRFYIERLLDAGFHVAGIDVGVSCGSPAAADVCQDLWVEMVERRRLNRKTRLLAQSNGGLIAYAWAFRHPDCVDRLAGIYPATDLASWPGLPNLLVYPAKGLGFDLPRDQLSRRLAQVNPIDNLAPLAKAGVKLLHLHGDKDSLVPIDKHSDELVSRYRKLGGAAELIVMPGLGHGGRPFVESSRLIAFLLAK